MYFCAVNGNSRVMTCTLSSAHWQQGFKGFLLGPIRSLTDFDFQVSFYFYLCLLPTSLPSVCDGVYPYAIAHRIRHRTLNTPRHRTLNTPSHTEYAIAHRIRHRTLKALREAQSFLQAQVLHHRRRTDARVEPPTPPPFDKVLIKKREG